MLSVYPLFAATSSATEFSSLLALLALGVAEPVGPSGVEIPTIRPEIRPGTRIRTQLTQTTVFRTIRATVALLVREVPPIFTIASVTQSTEKYPLQCEECWITYICTFLGDLTKGAEYRLEDSLKGVAVFIEKKPLNFFYLEKWIKINNNNDKFYIYLFFEIKRQITKENFILYIWEKYFWPEF